MAYTTQIAQAFLTDRSDEDNIIAGLDPGPLHRVDQAEQDDKPARIIANPRRGEQVALAVHGDVCARREDGVEMGDNGDAARCTAGRAGTAADHIADLVNADIVQPERPHPRRHFSATRLFGEWRGGDFGQLDQALIIERAHGLDLVKGGLDLIVGQQAGDNAVIGRRHHPGRRSRRRHPTGAGTAAQRGEGGKTGDDRSGGHDSS